MKDRSRRSFVKQIVAGAGAYGMASSAASGETKHRAIGVQLYTVRSIILNNPAQVLKAIDEIGFREAEVIWASLDKIWGDLKHTKLKAVSIHMDSQLFKPGNRDQLDSALNDVKEKGFEYVVYPAVPRPERNSDLEFFRALADILNEVGTKCHKLGLQLCYHNHAFDFRPIGSTTPLETLLTRTSRESLALEVDVFWVSVAGHDPVEFLNKYSGRIPLLHLKNKGEGLPVQFNESVPASAFRAVGDGSLDVPAILKAATSIGTKHFFVEQDQTPGDPIVSLRESYAYLVRLGL
jgi:sugar phosphate isomerase/epimerase